MDVRKFTAIMQIFPTGLLFNEPYILKKNRLQFGVGGNTAYLWRIKLFSGV